MANQRLLHIIFLLTGVCAICPPTYNLGVGRVNNSNGSLANWNAYNSSCNYLYSIHVTDLVNEPLNPKYYDCLPAGDICGDVGIQVCCKQLNSTVASSEELTPARLLAVMPRASSCATGPVVECLTAVQAAPLLAASFIKYDITHSAAQAAILTLIAVESGELKYNQHYNNGAPALTGQGTYNEMSPSFILQYGLTLDILDTNPLIVMKKINQNPENSIASAAWFMRQFCALILPRFETAPDDAYRTYITSADCIGTTMSEDRNAYWAKAKAALGVTTA